MASKRKSTTPCMIPSKVTRPAEEADRDSPVLLRQSRISGAPPAESSKLPEDGAGTYTCKPCDYETRDLNLFLDHVYSGHPDFRADPGFFCVSCGVSAPKFEGLALHNARVHPSTLNTSLRLRRRDRRAVVEQTLLLSGPDGEISITKTPIMRMMKGKSESKRIAVSHPVSEEPAAAAARGTERKETPAVTVTHVPTIVHNGTAKVSLPSAIQIVNGSGALPMLKTPITQVVSMVQNRSLHQAMPITTSSTISSASYATSKNLPKVMIPLSSIPTYSASMDSSSFLKTSFSKFPYPTKAELCYLTVVTKFPEEQIKIWFTAQRLKQGISWSPEEIEEARRKMFSTIIQTGPSHGGHHGSAQHTITVLPASLGAAGIPHLLQGSLVSQGGVIVTQPMMANGIQVSAAPVAMAVTPKPQAAARPTMHARPAAEKGGVGVLVGTVGGGGSRVIVSSSSGGGGGSRSGRQGSIITSGHASVINLSLGAAKVSNGKHGGANDAGGVGGVGGHVNAKTGDVRRASGGGVIVVLKGDIKGAAESKNAADGKSITGDGQRRKDGGRRKSTSSAEDGEPDTGDAPAVKMEEAASSPASKSSPASPAAAAPSGTSGSLTPGSLTPGSLAAVNAFLDPSFYKGKKSQEQLKALKDSFLRGQFPDQEEVDRLIALTGLTVREVRKWFSDRRYHFRNLKGVRSGGPGKSGGGDPASESGGNSEAKMPQHGSAPLSPTASQTPTSPSTPSRRLPRPPSPDFTAIRYKERDPHQLKALESSFVQDPDPAGEEVDRLRSETKMTRREIHGWFADRRKKMAAEKKKEESQRAMRTEAETEADGEERQKDDASGEPKVNPIKINLKMLKVTEANGKAEGEASDVPLQPGGVGVTAASDTPKPASTPAPRPSQSPKPAAVRGKKTAEQLQTLKQVYARTQWPSAAQYDHMLSGTGLARPEVVRWFGDCRYVQKNGQLKWLEAYQTSALEEELRQGNTGELLQKHYDAHGSPEEAQLQDLSQSCGLTADLVRHWFSTKATPPGPEPTTTSAAAHEKEPRPAAPSAGTEPRSAGGETEEEKKEAEGGEGEKEPKKEEKKEEKAREEEKEKKEGEMKEEKVVEEKKKEEKVVVEEKKKKEEKVVVEEEKKKEKVVVVVEEKKKKEEKVVVVEEKKKEKVVVVEEEKKKKEGEMKKKDKVEVNADKTVNPTEGTD